MNVKGCLSIDDYKFLELECHAEIDAVKEERVGHKPRVRCRQVSADVADIDIAIDLIACDGNAWEQHHRVADPKLSSSQLVLHLRTRLWQEGKLIASNGPDVAALSKQTAGFRITRVVRRNFRVATANRSLLIHIS